MTDQAPISNLASAPATPQKTNVTKRRKYVEYSVSTEDDEDLKVITNELKVKIFAYVLLGLSLIGICGMHRMFLRKYRTGFLYLFTFGLFGIGTLWDAFHLHQMITEFAKQKHQIARVSPRHHSKMYNDVSRLVREFCNNLAVRTFNFGAAVILMLLPLHWLFLVIFVSIFSLGWGVGVGAVLCVYPQLLWERREKQPINIWTPITQSPLFRPLFEYFPISLHKTENQLSNYALPSTSDLDPKTKYLFGYHPHGVYSFGLFSIVFPTISGWDKMFPGVKAVVGVANSLLCVPLLCTLFGWLGFIPASGDSMLSAFKQGYSVVIVPGGIAEMIVGDDKENEVVFLKQRKGFIKFAISHGIHLVPIYGFGENETFHRYSFWKNARLNLSRKLRITIQLFSGRWKTLIPYNVPLSVVVGNPLRVEYNPSPTPEQVESVLHEYIEELTRLFESNKHKFKGYENKKLVVL